MFLIVKFIINAIESAVKEISPILEIRTLGHHDRVKTLEEDQRNIFSPSLCIGACVEVYLVIIGGEGFGIFFSLR